MRASSRLRRSKQLTGQTLSGYVKTAQNSTITLRKHTTTLKLSMPMRMSCAEQRSVGSTTQYSATCINHNRLQVLRLTPCVRQEDVGVEL